MRQIISCIAALIITFSFAACNKLDDVSFTDTNSNPIVEQKDTEIFKVMFEDTEISLGEDSLTEISDSWEIEEKTEDSKNSEVPVSYKMHRVKDEEEIFYDVRVSLKSNKEIIYSIYADCSSGIENGELIEGIELPNIIFGKKLTWGSTYKEVISTLGEPSTKTNILDDHTLTYYYSDGQAVVKIKSDGSFNGFGVYSINVVKSYG